MMMMMILSPSSFNMTLIDVLDDILLKNCYVQCFKNWIDHLIGKVTNSWFIGRTSGRIAVEPIKS